MHAPDVLPSSSLDTGAAYGVVYRSGFPIRFRFRFRFDIFFITHRKAAIRQMICNLFDHDDEAGANVVSIMA